MRKLCMLIVIAFTAALALPMASSEAATQIKKKKTITPPPFFFTQKRDGWGSSIAASVKRGKWEKQRFLGMELYNHTLGVIGLGTMSYLALARRGVQRTRTQIGSEYRRGFRSRRLAHRDRLLSVLVRYGINYFERRSNHFFSQTACFFKIALCSDSV